MHRGSAVEDREYKPHPYHWVVEPLMEIPSYIEKSMFGCRAIYIYGKLVLVLAARKDEAWNGILIPTEKTFHHSLLNDFTDLRIHSVLGKWVYLSIQSEKFDEISSLLVRSIQYQDERFGVLPKPHGPRKKSFRKIVLKNKESV